MEKQEPVLALPFSPVFQIDTSFSPWFQQRTQSYSRSQTSQPSNAFSTPFGSLSPAVTSRRSICLAQQASNSASTRGLLLSIPCSILASAFLSFTLVSAVSHLNSAASIVFLSSCKSHAMLSRRISFIVRFVRRERSPKDVTSVAARAARRPVLLLNWMRLCREGASLLRIGKLDIEKGR